MPHKRDSEIIAALAAAVDEISANGNGIQWWQGEQVAPIAYRRWHSFARRNKSHTPTHDQRVNDLVKGLQSHFELDIPYTHVNDWRSLAEPLASLADGEC